jgi:RHH-type proline utilization regulon transcriptional repressor/proline dehydrogenase/delta 1-pyrroline-5-carboxylate dehydrogenase
MRDAGLRVVEMPLPAACARGTFVAPTLIDLGPLSGLSHLTHEVFGPVLHVLRWKRGELPALVSSINATGYGLTHGIHTRIDETVSAIVTRIKAGNVYVNRNIVGAVVGVQPFGGHRLSGTGPKAGGRCICGGWCVTRGRRCRARRSCCRGRRVNRTRSNSIRVARILCMAKDERTLVSQVKAMRALGNTVVMLRDHHSLAVRDHLDGADIILVDKIDPAKIDAALLDLSDGRLQKIRAALAESSRAIVPVVISIGQRRRGLDAPRRRADADREHRRCRRQSGAPVAVRGHRASEVAHAVLEHLRQCATSTPTRSASI